MTANSAVKPFALGIFRRRDFALMWASLTLVQFGSGLTAIAASVVIYQSTGSAASVGFMLIATSLPGLLFGLVAGVFVDQLDRRRLMVFCELGRGVVLALIPILFSSGHWTLYLLMAVASTLIQFLNPAHASALPDVASEEELDAAHSFLTASEAAALGLGFAFAGVLTQWYNPAWAFIIAVVCCVLSAAALAAVRLPATPVDQKTSVKAVVVNLRDGSRFLSGSPILRSLMVIMAFTFASLGFDSTIALPFVDRALGAPSSVYGIIEAISLLGFLVGGFWMVVVSDRLREGQWIVVALLGIGVVKAFYSQVHLVPLAVAAGLFFYFFNVPAFVARSLIIQRNTSRDVRIRVTSFFYVTRDVCMVIGMSLSGLADIFNVRTLVLADSLVFISLGVICIFLPGLGRPAKEWRRAIGMLRGVPDARGLGIGRTATLADLDLLMKHLPEIATLSLGERQRLVTQMTYQEAAAGTVVVRKGARSDDAWFVLEGRAVAGISDEGRERVLEVMNKGDIFGEIAALMGVPRTADVVVDVKSALLKVSSKTLRVMNEHPELRRLFRDKMTARMVRTDMLEGLTSPEYNPRVLRDLRTEQEH